MKLNKKVAQMDYKHQITKLLIVIGNAHITKMKQCVLS
jgi:hypothetical protein